MKRRITIICSHYRDAVEFIRLNGWAWNEVRVCTQIEDIKGPELPSKVIYAICSPSRELYEAAERRAARHGCRIKFVELAKLDPKEL